MSPAKAEAPPTGLRLLSKAEILTAPDLPSEEIPVPEWQEGAAVKVRALDVNRRQAYYEFVSIVNRENGTTTIETKPWAPHSAALAALAIVDENDEPLFTLAEVEALGTKNPDVINRIADAARRLSRMRPEDREEARNGLHPTNGASPSA